MIHKFLDKIFSRIPSCPRADECEHYTREKFTCNKGNPRHCGVYREKGG